MMETKEYYEYLILQVYRDYNIVPTTELSLANLSNDLANLPNTTTEEIKEVLTSISEKTKIVKTKIENQKSSLIAKIEIENVEKKFDEIQKNNTVLKNQLAKAEQKVAELEKNNIVLKNQDVKLSSPFIKLIETIKLYYSYLQEQLNIESKSDTKLHERFTKPFLFTIALFTIEAIVIHSHFWGSSLLAVVILLILNVLAYADQNSVIPFVAYEGYKRLREAKTKAEAKGENFNPSFSVIDDIYRAKLKNTFGVVRYLAVITFLISFIQFIFNGYHYDNVPDSIKLGVDANLDDLLARFYYIYTYKNILIAVFMGFLAHYTVKVSVKIELPKIYKSIIDRLENEN